ncbi:hypothetical protein [Paenibacillus dendritiformis]|uniref:hypothetical protein n=1 Tax=Paenibacillus dendritiformis TaxID=130049 RepID=UPI00387E0348
MPIVECTENVYVKNAFDGEPAFVKGKRYRTYSYNLRNGYDIKEVLCAKNEFNVRHIIQKEENDGFYGRHFVEVKKR